MNSVVGKSLFMFTIHQVLKYILDVLVSKVANMLGLVFTEN